MRREFNGFLSVKWHRPEDKMPLDDHFKNFPWSVGDWGVITDVLVLINDETDPNEDPAIVQLQFLKDNDGSDVWCFCTGEPYHNCHAKNIKFWAEVPDYTKASVQNFKQRILPTCDQTCIEEGCDCDGWKL